MKISIFDSTLRDGSQGEGISFSPSDKLKILHALDELGIDYVEAGNPASNPKDLEFFKSLGEVTLKHAVPVAFGSTRHKNIAVAQDEGLRGLLAAQTKAVAIFGKTSLFHVKTVLETTEEENLRMIRESVQYLKENGRFVIFDAEHAFDGWREDERYARLALLAAKEGGADIICLCDTNGASGPEEICAVVRAARDLIPGVELGIHCHDDCGLAVADAMAAVGAGATHVQGTFLGFGERCGNARLSTLIPNLQLKRGYECIPPENMAFLTPTAIKIADIANFKLPGSLPYVGSSAFAHKGGMHVDAVSKSPRTFEHIRPQDVGNRRRVLVSEISGKSALMDKIRKYDPSLDRNSSKTREIVDKLKQMEYRGYQYEAAEESFDLVIRRTLGIQKKFFELDHFKIIGEQPLFNRLYPSSALVKVRVGKESALTAAEGYGPVHSLDLALRKALSKFYPSLEDVWLTDFKVRVIESDATTAANVRVLIESSDGKHNWATIGVSTDIIEASFLALADSIEYKLTLDSEEAR